jgi:Flp pilus assembly protein TadD
MKRCPTCGAKNKDNFEYCVRCSEPLDVMATPARTTSPVFTSVGLIILVVLCGYWGWQNLRTPESELPPSSQPGPAAPRSGTPAASAAGTSFDAGRAQASAREGIEAFNEERYEDARRFFVEFTAEAAENPFGHMYLGLSHYYLGDQDAAIEAMEDAFELAPANPGFGRYLVTMLMQIEDFPRAEAVVRRYLDARPDDTSARVELVRLMRRQGGLEEAIVEGEQLVEAAPEDLDAVLELGTSLKESGMFDEAEGVFRKAVELDPESATAQHALGVTALVAGDYTKAREPLEKAVQLDPERALYRLSLAQTYENLDRIPESLAEYEAFVELAPDDPRAQKIEQLVKRARQALEERSRARRETGGEL